MHQIWQNIAKNFLESLSYNILNSSIFINITQFTYIIQVWPIPHCLWGGLSPLGARHKIISFHTFVIRCLKWGAITHNIRSYPLIIPAWELLFDHFIHKSRAGNKGWDLFSALHIRFNVCPSVHILAIIPIVQLRPRSKSKSKS